MRRYAYLDKSDIAGLIRNGVLLRDLFCVKCVEAGETTLYEALKILND